MPRHLALPGHLLIHGVYPELKRLRETPPVVDWSSSGRASPFSEMPRPSRLPDSRAAPSIFHCLEGSSVVAITSRDRPCSCYFFVDFGRSPRACSARAPTPRASRGALSKRFEAFFSVSRSFGSARADAPHHHPSVSLAQLKKQNDKESAQDMTGYKPSTFDKGFRDGKGWGDLVRRGSLRFSSVSSASQTRRASHAPRRRRR